MFVVAAILHKVKNLLAISSEMSALVTPTDAEEELKCIAYDFVSSWSLLIPRDPEEAKVLGEINCLLESAFDTLEAKTIKYTEESHQSVCHMPLADRCELAERLGTSEHEEPGHTCGVPYCAEHLSVKVKLSEIAKNVVATFRKDLDERGERLRRYRETKSSAGKALYL